MGYSSSKNNFSCTAISPAGGAVYVLQVETEVSATGTPSLSRAVVA
ncbi:hypothetical protein [Pseudomonas sp.]|nr:hypothetical protein [Pseudomonas sp.]